MAMKRIAAMLLTSVLLLSCVGCAQDGRKEPNAEKADRETADTAAAKKAAIETRFRMNQSPHY